jgi:vacuolar protein sorting-associated protein VTA1
MPLTIPAELKKITPYVRRAEELDRDKGNPESRLVAYYCRQYAVHIGIPLTHSAESKKCLGAILGDLEAEKVAMSNFTRDESKFLCRQFADKIFNKADGEDRLGMASKTTARTFYAASSFFEILQQFYEKGEVSEEREEEKKRIIYAKWKSAEILKAFKEGRQPTSGGYGETEVEDEVESEEEEEEKEEKETHEKSNGAPEVIAIPPPPMPPPVETVQEDEGSEEEQDFNEEGTEVELLGPPPAFPGVTIPVEDFVADSPPPSVDRPPIAAPIYKPPTPVSKPEPKKSASFFGMGKKKATSSVSKVSKQALADSVELTNFALVALQNKDAELGATRLKQALAALGQ